MDSTHSVGAGFVDGLFELTDSLGLPRQALLEQAGLGSQTAPRADARWPMAAVIALFDAAAVLAGRSDLGLEFGRRARPGTFHVLGYALMTCQTLGQAIALVPHYRRLVFDIGYSEMRLDTEGPDAVLRWQVVSRTMPYSACLAESLLSAWFCFGRWMSGVDRPLREIRFQHPAPESTAAYEAFFECPVRFGAGENALVFSRELLDRPLVQANATLHLAMREQARAAMDAAFKDQDLAQRLRQALIPLMPKCEANLKHAAAALALSPRSLQRKLAEASLGFQDVLDAARQDLARIYLRDPALSALDVALLLGFAEQSSFTRAFRQWFGQTPTEWRRHTHS